MQYVLPLMLQQAHRLGAARTGLILFPSGITQLRDDEHHRKDLQPGRPAPARPQRPDRAYSITTAWLSRLGPAASLGLIATLASLRGLAMGLCMMPVQTAAYNTVPREQMTRATALSNVLFRIFGATTTALLTTVLLVGLQLQGAPEGSTVTSGTTPLPLPVQRLQRGLPGDGDHGGGRDLPLPLPARSCPRRAAQQASERARGPASGAGRLTRRTSRGQRRALARRSYARSPSALCPLLNHVSAARVRPLRLDDVGEVHARVAQIERLAARLPRRRPALDARHPRRSPTCWRNCAQRSER